MKWKLGDRKELWLWMPDIFRCFSFEMVKSGSILVHEVMFLLFVLLLLLLLLFCFLSFTNVILQQRISSSIPDLSYSCNYMFWKNYCVAIIIVESRTWLKLKWSLWPSEHETISKKEDVVCFYHQYMISAVAQKQFCNKVCQSFISVEFTLLIIILFLRA